MAYFDAANLSQGRDPSLFKYATESGGSLFYQRLRQQLGRELGRDNFFFRFFFFEPEHLPESILPPCYQANNYVQLRAQLPKLRILEGEATAYLLSSAGHAITKASLSNIFEYVSPADFLQVAEALGQRPAPLRLVFWDLLQNQAQVPHAAVPLLAGLSAELSAQEACFTSARCGCWLGNEGRNWAGNRAKSIQLKSHNFINYHGCQPASPAPGSCFCAEKTCPSAFFKKSETTQFSLPPSINQVGPAVISGSHSPQPPAAMSCADYCHPAFLEQIMRRHAPARDIRVRAVRPLALDSSSSILTALTAGRSAKPVGHFGLEVDLHADGRAQPCRWC